MPRTTPVIVRTPFSRRRLLAWAVGIASVVGATKAAVWLAGRPAGPGEVTPAVPAQPTVPSHSPRALLVATPTDGVWPVEANDIRDHIRDALPAVNGAAGGRYRIDLLEIPQPKPYRPQIEQLLPWLATGGAPDLVVTTRWPTPGEVIPDFATPATAGLFSPLDSHLGAAGALGGLRLQDLYPVALDLCRHKGQLLGVPLRAAPTVLAFDVHRFTDAQEPLPDANWEWPDLRTAAGRLTGGPDGGAADEYGFFPGWNAEALLALIWQDGEDVVEPTGTRTRLLEPRVLAALESFADLHRGRALCPPLGAAPSSGSSWKWGADGILINGRHWVGMAYTEMSASHLHKWLASPGRAPDERHGMAEPPRGRTRATLLGVPAVLSLFRRAPDQALAAEALAALADRVTRELVPSSRRVTADQLVARLLALKGSLGEGDARALAAALGYGRAFVLPHMDRAGHAHIELSRLSFALRATRGPSVREAAERAAAAIDAILARP